MLTALSFCCNLNLPPIFPDPPNTNLRPSQLGREGSLSTKTTGSRARASSM